MKINFHWCINAVTHHGTWAACPLVPPHALPPFQWSPPGEPHPHWRCLYPWPEQELWACGKRNEVGEGQRRRTDKGIQRRHESITDILLQYCYSGSIITSINQVTFIIRVVTFTISDDSSSNSSNVSIPGLYRDNTFTIFIIIAALHQYVHLPPDTPVLYSYFLYHCPSPFLSPVCLTLSPPSLSLSFLLSSLSFTLCASTSYFVISILFIYFCYCKPTKRGRTWVLIPSHASHCHFQLLT